MFGVVVGDVYQLGVFVLLEDQWFIVVVLVGVLVGVVYWVFFGGVDLFISEIVLVSVVLLW